jgi:3-phosphoshikimate 1-carboxyvinyltransferase
MSSDSIVVHETKRLNGEVTVPGDKSISHRAIILGSLAQGKVMVKGLSSGEDNRRTVKIFQQLGVSIKKRGPAEYLLHGKGLHGLQEPGSILYAGNSGTTMRLMTGVLSGQPFFSVLSGDASLNARPMKRVVTPLREMGARISGRDGGNYAPLAIQGGKLQAARFALPVASAQVKTAILLAGFYADGTTMVQEPIPSRDHTERMLRYLGAPLQVSAAGLAVTGGGELKGDLIEVPGDLSSAAFLIVAGLLVHDAEVLVRSVGVNPTRTGFLEILQNMGARIELLNMREMSGEPVADIRVRAGKLTGVTINGAIIPRTIDELPILAVAAAYAEGTTIIRDARELRVKETDRIAAMCTELKKMGADIEAQDDGMIIRGKESLSAAVCTSYGDHRVAMSMAVAGLAAQGETRVEDCACIKTSFPGFMNCLQSLMG